MIRRYRQSHEESGGLIPLHAFTRLSKTSHRSCAWREGSGLGHIRTRLSAYPGVDAVAMSNGIL